MASGFSDLGAPPLPELPIELGEMIAGHMTPGDRMIFAFDNFTDEQKLDENFPAYKSITDSFVGKYAPRMPTGGECVSSVEIMQQCMARGFMLPHLENFALYAPIEVIEWYINELAHDPTQQNQIIWGAIYCDRADVIWLYKPWLNDNFNFNRAKSILKKWETPDWWRQKSHFVHRNVNDTVLISMYKWLLKNREPEDAKVFVRMLMRSCKLNVLEAIKFPLEWVSTSYSGDKRTLLWAKKKGIQEGTLDIFLCGKKEMVQEFVNNGPFDYEIWYKVAFMNKSDVYTCLNPYLIPDDIFDYIKGDDSTVKELLLAYIDAKRQVSHVLKLYPEITRTMSSTKAFEIAESHGPH